MKKTKTLSRRSEFGSSMLWKAFSSISPSHACSPIPTRQLGFPLQFLLEKEVMINLLPIPTLHVPQTVSLSAEWKTKKSPDQPMYSCFPASKHSHALPLSVYMHLVRHSHRMKFSDVWAGAHYDANHLVFIWAIYWYLKIQRVEWIIVVCHT